MSKYKVALTDILNDVVEGLQFPVNIYKATSVPTTAPQVGNNITLNVDNVYHAQFGFTVSIGGNNYTIVSWVDTPGQEQLVVNDASGVKPINVTPGIPLMFNMYGVNFFWGTPRETNTEATQIKSAFDKYPMIWLWTYDNENNHDDELSAIERESPVKLFFLTTSNFKLQTENIDTMYIKPMRRLLDNFVEAINTNWATFQRLNLDYKTRNYTKFGIYINGKGVNEQLFADGLSGIELDVTLKILKTNCLC